MQNNQQQFDNKLRDLEGQASADISRMDDHWQQFKKDMLPGTSAPKPIGKYLWWVVSLGVIVCAVVLLVNRKPETNNSIPIVENHQKNDTVPLRPRDSLPAKHTRQASVHVRKTRVENSEFTDSGKRTSAIARKTSVHRKANPVFSPLDTDSFKKRRPVQNRRRVILPAKTTDGRDVSIEAEMVDDSIPSPTERSREKIESFFNHFQTLSQTFRINNEYDTVINGIQGTTLFIPAGAFNGHENVVLFLREFYRFEDIITQRLFTTSAAELLTTGGMIHLSATHDGNELTMAAGKSIRWLMPENFTSTQEMQLYTRNGQGDFRILTRKENSEQNNQSLDWVQNNAIFGKKILTATAQTPVFLTDTLMLESNSKTNMTLVAVRDTLRIVTGEAPRDWNYESQNGRVTINNISSTLTRLGERYGVDVSTLGWLNCDRFNNSMQRTDQYVDLPGESSEYEVMLVFTRQKGMMKATIIKNKFVFPRVPEGEPAILFCIRADGNRIFSATKPITVSGNAIKGLEFEETTPEKFRVQAAALDNR